MFEPSGPSTTASIDPAWDGRESVAKMDTGEMIAGSRRYRVAVAVTKGTVN